MFRGINSVTLDEKGRIALPVRYREDLHYIVVTIDPAERCLLAYPAADWEEIEAKLESLPSFNEAARRIQRLLIGHAAELSLDNSGRVLLPQALREYADLSKSVTLVGQGKKFEIWSAGQWDSRCSDWLAMASDKQDLPVELQTLSL